MGRERGGQRGGAAAQMYSCIRWEGGRCVRAHVQHVAPRVCMGAALWGLQAA